MQCQAGLWLLRLQRRMRPMRPHHQDYHRSGSRPVRVNECSMTQRTIKLAELGDARAWGLWLREQFDTAEAEARAAAEQELRRSRDLPQVGSKDKWSFASASYALLIASDRKRSRHGMLRWSGSSWLVQRRTSSLLNSSCGTMCQSRLYGFSAGALRAISSWP
jgi:hypothetical protein